MKLIVSAHGMLAKEVVNSAGMVFGAIDDLDIVTFVPGENAETLKARYKELIDGYKEDEEILFLVDLFGGSPYNAAFETVIGQDRMDVITGLSLPMLIDVVGIRTMEEDIKAGEVYDKLSGDYVKSCKKLLGNTNEDEMEDDEVAKDQIRKTLLLQVGPPGVKVSVVDVAKAVRVYNNPKYEKDTVFFLYTCPQDVLRMAEAGVPIKSVNIGGMAFKTGKTQITKAVSVDESDIAAFKKLHEMGIELEIRPVATDKKVDLMSKIEGIEG